MRTGYQSAEFRLPEPEEGWEARDRLVAELQSQEYDEAAAELEAQHRRLEKMGVPRRVWGLLTADKSAISSNKALVAMRAFLTKPDHEKSTAMLLGGTGAGKTLAASLWLRHVATPKYSGTKPKRFISSTEFCTISAYDEEKLKLIFKASFLVLDDVGEDYSDKRDFNVSRLAHLMGARHADMLPTVITSNMPTEEFSKTYGERIESRMADAIVTNLEGEPDLRKAVGGENQCS